MAFFGGTIDSYTTSLGSRAVNSSTPTYEPLKKCLKACFPDCEIEIIHPAYRIDSSQLTPYHLVNIALWIEEQAQKYNTVIVGFGTDTMAYVLPWIGICFGSTNRLVILVGGMSAWSEWQDGFKNILDAVHVARVESLKGVLMVSNGSVFHSKNLRKLTHLSQYPFCNVNLQNSMAPNVFDALSRLLETGLVISKISESSYDFSFPIMLKKEEREELFRKFKWIQEQKLGWRGGVGMLYVYPGLTSELVKNFAQSDVRHLILLCYANGTACVGDSEFSMSEATKALVDSKKCVYIISQQIGSVSDADYTVCKSLVENGAVYVNGFTAETLYAVLLALDLIDEPETVKEKVCSFMGCPDAVHTR